ncbi:3'-5' exonuclease [Bacillaceae bacterium Marseille-Q3522]|nr:3'-5' exonuclease [Bacillaceae bacterium Marseille-Q3522]
MAFFHFMKGLQGIFGGERGSQDPQQMAFLRQLQREMRVEEVMTIPLEQLEAVVFDIETTGFFPDKGDQIISIGAVKVKGEAVLEEDTFYSPAFYDKPLLPEIAEITGLTAQELRNAPALSEVIIQFFQFAQNRPLVAHHARHEKNFMQLASWQLFRAPLRHRIVDTTFLSKIAEPDVKLIRLEDFCEHHRIPVINRHHALGDAILTAKLWGIYVQKLKNIGCRTLHDIYERLAAL